MKAVVLAAGEGQRMRPFTYTQPKVMLPVANKPILEYAIQSLSKTGIKDITLIVGYKKERIQNYFEDGKNWNTNLTYVEQNKQLGTAHALKQTKKELKNQDKFLLLNGDTLVDKKRIQDIKDQKNAILTSKTERPQDYGAIQTKNHRVQKIIEKPNQQISKKVNTGVYSLTPKIFKAIEEIELSPRGEYEITTAIQKLIEKDIEFKAIESTGLWVDAVYPWNLLEVNQKMLQKQNHEQNGKIKPGATVAEDASIGENTKIRPGTYILGPTKIGKNCDIGPNTVILPSTSIRDNSSIGPNTTIENSILMRDCRIKPNTYITNSVLGNYTKIGAQTTLDAAKTQVKVNDELIEVDKVGSMIGESTTIGTNTSIKPGTLIGKNCDIGSNQIVRENVQSNTKVR
ncbi:glucose-1-phosphate thymidylyltransferase [archaeon SCG-AAA382B04]|nr:glucose-1-phosphate thymidylyltransferase [archaeon SCG-AAA382B04]